jgi:hypothetical protein
MMKEFEETLRDIDQRCREHKIPHAVERNDMLKHLEEMLKLTKSRRKK